MTTTPPPRRRRFIILLEEVAPGALTADAPPAERRLAGGLKHLLRFRGLKALRVTEVPENDAEPATDLPTDGG